MGNDTKRKRMKRRKVHWGRVIIFLFISLIIILALSWAAYSVYLTGKSAYQEYNTLVEDFDRRSSLQTKFQSERFNDYTNILILGIDDNEIDDMQSGRYSDTVLVASINHKTGFINFLAIPRDTKVKIPGRKGEEKINQAYYYGGVQLAVRTVEDVLQLPIQHYFIVDMKVFAEIVDVLGGLSLYVENDMDYEDPYAELAIHLKQGYQYLNGEEAIQYLRYRSDELGDIGRVQRQQKFLKAMYAELFRVDMLAKLPTFFDVMNRRVTTSIAVMDGIYLAKNMSSASPECIKTEMLPGNYSAANGVNYWVIDAEKLGMLIDEMFQNNKEK